jgi:cobalamin biosynthesis protein CobW
MERLLARADRLDGIVVETSGLALPEPLVAAFGWPTIRTRTRVNAVVTVVDGEALAAGHVVGDASAVEAQRRADPSLDHLTALEDLFADQLEAADLVLMSRADRLTPEDLEAVRGRLDPHLRPGTTVLPMARGSIDPRVVLAAPVSLAGADPRSAGDLEHDHAHAAMESLVVRRTGHWEREGLERQLRRLLADHPVVRLKGRLRQGGKRLPLQIQAVGPRLECWYEGGGAGLGDEPGLELVVVGAAADAERLAAAFATI